MSISKVCFFNFFYLKAAFFIIFFACSTNSIVSSLVYGKILLNFEFKQLKFSKLLNSQIAFLGIIAAISSISFFVISPGTKTVLYSVMIFLLFSISSMVLLSKLSKFLLFDFFSESSSSSYRYGDDLISIAT